MLRDADTNKASKQQSKRNAKSKRKIKNEREKIIFAARCVCEDGDEDEDGLGQVEHLLRHESHST